MKDKVPINILREEDIVVAEGKLIDQQPAYDELISSKVQLQHRDQLKLGKVMKLVQNP